MVVPYGLLTNLRYVIDGQGLQTGVSNTYGELDGSNVVTNVKNILGSVTDTYTLVGTAGAVTWDPVTKLILCSGAGRLRSGGAASLYDFFSNAASYADIKWTAFFVVKIGNTYKQTPVAYGIMGNNGASTASKGCAFQYSNTNGTTEDALSAYTTRGTASNYLGRFSVPGTGPSNTLMVWTVQFDGNASSNVRMRHYINDQPLLNIEMLNNNTSPQATPTNVMEIFGAGNSQVPMVGAIGEIIVAEEATTFSNTISIIRALMNKWKIVRSRPTDYLDKSTVPQIFVNDTATVSTYRLCGVIGQLPNTNTVFEAHALGAAHVYAAGKKIVGRVSTRKAYPDSVSFGSVYDVYDPAGNDAVQDMGGGPDNNGVFHLFADVLDGSTPPVVMVSARHLYSSDLTNWTNTDITSSLHADGLNAYRMYGNMIHVGGVWIKGYYKLTDNGDTTQSANYILRSTNGTSWTSVEVRAPAATYINECTVWWAGGDNIGYLARNEATGEWSVSMSTDLGLTWSAMSALTFGETVTSPNPPMCKSFTHNGVLLNVAYITNRNNDTAFAIYGKASDIAADPVNGWDIGTKIQFWKTSLAPFHYHYGDVAHLDDTIKAVGAYPYDQYPSTGSGTSNAFQIFTMPTWHIPIIESELGI